MLFEKLVKQHRVHLVVAHTVGFSFFVAHDQIRIHLFYVFGHKSELRCACRINLFLVAEGDRLKRKERFAGLSIGLMSSLKRFEEVVVPSLSSELMKTGIPLADVWPKILPI